MLSDYDIGYSLIGHSESRKFLNESNQDILKKYKQLKIFNKANNLYWGIIRSERKNYFQVL